MRDQVGDLEWLALVDEPFDHSAALSFLSQPSAGGVVVFLGVVRDFADERTGVTSIEYDAYEEQVTKSLSSLVERARSRWPELRRAVIWHRVGEVPAGEPSVLVGASAPHRAEAFDACEYLIDTLKSSAPIWKKEHWPGGAEWSPAAQPIIHRSGSEK